MHCPRCQHENSPSAKFCEAPLVARCHLGLGKLYRRTGKHQQAPGEDERTRMRADS